MGDPSKFNETAFSGSIGKLTGISPSRVQILKVYNSTQSKRNSDLSDDLSKRQSTSSFRVDLSINPPPQTTTTQASSVRALQVLNSYVGSDVISGYVITNMTSPIPTITLLQSQNLGTSPINGNIDVRPIIGAVVGSGGKYFIFTFYIKFYV